MYIKSLHIISFGGLRNRDIELTPGVNILCGENESGKTSAAMFIKFIFYGLGSKSQKGSSSERQRFVNRDTMQASGFMIVETDSRTSYRLERTLILSDNSPAREKVRIINLTTGETVSSQEPGEYFFGVPEDIFVSTCFVSQSASLKPENSKLDGVLSTSDKNENLLLSGDESIDVKRGLKKLNDLRRELCHKNGGGGEITELREKRASLAAELEKTAERSHEIIAAGISLDDINKRLFELEAAHDRYAALFSSLDKIVVKRRLDALEQAKQKLGAVKSQLSEIESKLPPETDAALDSAEHDIRAYDELIVAYDEEFSDFDDADDDEADDESTVLPEDAEDDIEEANALYADSRTKLALSIAMMIGGVLGLAAFFILYFFNTDIYSIPLIITIALVTLGIVFIAKYISVKNQLAALLDKWDAESIDEFETAVTDKLNKFYNQKDFEEEKKDRTENADTAKLKFDAAQSYVLSLADSLNIEHGDSIYDTIDAIKAVSADAKKKKSELTLLAEKLSGRVDTLSELTEGVDVHAAELEAQKVLSTEIGKTAAAIDSEKLKEATRERDFTENALKSAQKRKSALEEKLLSLGKLSHTPDEYRSMINSIDDTIEELTLRHDACELAMSAITEAGENMRTGINVRLAESATELIRSCTPHDSVALDASLNPSLESGSRHLSTDILSRGTADITYLGIRNALCGEMFPSERPVTVFDECFAHIDINRTKNFFRALSGGQYLILTCREDETNAARSLGISIIEM